MIRRIFSTFCALTLCVLCLPGVGALEGEARRAADTLITLGLLEEEEYDLSQPADRVSATVMLVRLSGEREAQSGKHSAFRDVPKWADISVSYAVRRGWVAAFSDTQFDPEENLMANSWFAMLLRMLGYQDSEGEFEVSDAATFARRIGLASRAYTGILTCGDLFESALDALRFPYRNGGGTVIEHLVEEEICTRAAVSALGLDRQELTARQVADRHMSAVFALSLYDLDEPVEKIEPSADASGFFITADGLALTNYHSIEGAVQAVATLITGEACPVERVVWYDVEMDLAVIRVSDTTLDNRKISMFSALTLCGTAELRPGDTAYTLSNPLGFGLAVSEGVISATAREVERYKLPCVMTTADISKGSSGGALLNVFGHVIAVTSGAYRVGNSMYLAVPVDAVSTLDLSLTGMTLAEVTEKEGSIMEKAETPLDEIEEPGGSE